MVHHDSIAESEPDHQKTLNFIWQLIPQASLAGNWKSAAAAVSTNVYCRNTKHLASAGLWSQTSRNYSFDKGGKNEVWQWQTHVTSADKSPVSDSFKRVKVFMGHRADVYLIQGSLFNLLGCLVPLLHKDQIQTCILLFYFVNEKWPLSDASPKEDIMR